MLTTVAERIAASIILMLGAGYLALWKQQNTNKKDIKILKELNIDGIKTDLVELQTILKQVNDRSINHLQTTISNMSIKLGSVQRDLKSLEYETVQSIERYKEFSDLGERLEQKNIDLKKADQLLETISKHPQEIKIINELEGFKQQLSKIEDIQKSQDLIIKVGTHRVSREHKNFKKLIEGGKGKEGGEHRYGQDTIEFGDEFGEEPQVMVAIAKIDADSRYNIRAHVYVTSTSTKEFTFAVDTWDNSIVYGASVAWIAIGKPKQ